MVLEIPMTKVLIYGGKTGWIGGLMHDMCKEKGESVEIGSFGLFVVVVLLLLRWNLP